VGADHEELAGLQFKTGQHIRLLNAIPVVVQHLAHWAAGLYHHIGRKPLAQQVIAGDGAVGQIDVGSVIDDTPVDFFRHAHVETAIARLHVEGRNLAALGRDHRHTTVSVAKHQHRIRHFCRQNTIDRDDHFADRFSAACARCIEEMIRLADAQVVEEYLVELVIIVLSGMDDHVLAMLVQPRHHTRQTNDLRAGSHHGQDFHFFHICIRTKNRTEPNDTARLTG